MCNFTCAINKFNLVRKHFTLTGIVMMCSKFFLAKKRYCVMPKKTWLLTYSLHRCEKKMTCFSFMTFLFWIKSSTFAVNCILFQALLFYKQPDTMKKKVFNIWKGIFCRFTMEHSNKYALCWIQKLDLFVTSTVSKTTW